MPEDFQPKSPIITKAPGRVILPKDFKTSTALFGKELGGFLIKVWEKRREINIEDPDSGICYIYNMYSNSVNLKFNPPLLEAFFTGLREATKGYKIEPQSHGWDPTRNKYLNWPIDLTLPNCKLDYWTDFFFVNNPNFLNIGEVRKRVYVNPLDWKYGLLIFQSIISKFHKKECKGLMNLKITGPGCLRNDKIVVYCRDKASQQFVVNFLNDDCYRLCLSDRLPNLVKHVAFGVGIADEPPSMNMGIGSRNFYSFGSFYATLIWAALKNIRRKREPKGANRGIVLENIPDNELDGRDMLDNLMYSLRVLEIDPKNSHSFPAADKLAAWYKAALAKDEDAQSGYPEINKRLNSLDASMKIVVQRYNATMKEVIRFKSRESMKALEYLHADFPNDIRTAKLDKTDPLWYEFPRKVIATLLGQSGSQTFASLLAQVSGKTVQNQSFSSLTGLTPLKTGSRMHAILSEEFGKLK